MSPLIRLTAACSSTLARARGGDEASGWMGESTARGRVPVAATPLPRFLLCVSRLPRCQRWRCGSAARLQGSMSESPTLRLGSRRGVCSFQARASWCCITGACPPTRLCRSNAALWADPISDDGMIRPSSDRGRFQVPEPARAAWLFRPGAVQVFAKGCSS